MKKYILSLLLFYITGHLFSQGVLRVEFTGAVGGNWNDRRNNLVLDGTEYKPPFTITDYDKSYGSIELATRLFLFSVECGRYGSYTIDFDSFEFNFDFGDALCGADSIKVWDLQSYRDPTCRDAYLVVSYVARMSPPEPDGPFELDNICASTEEGIRIRTTTTLPGGSAYIWQVAEGVSGPWQELGRTSTNTITTNAAAISTALGGANVFGRSTQIRVTTELNNFCAAHLSDDAITSAISPLFFFKEPPSSATLSPTGTSCQTTTDGAIRVSNLKYSDGSSYIGAETLHYAFIDPAGAPHLYDSKATSFTVNNAMFPIDAGNWSVIIESQDGKCRSGPFPVTVPVISMSLSGAVVNKNITCKDGADGEIKVNVANGKAPYKYELFDNSTFSGSPVKSQSGVSGKTYTFTGLPAGRYYARVTDNCTQVVRHTPGVQLSNPANPVSIANVSAVDVVCPDNPAAGKATVAITGGTPNFIYRLYRADNSPAGSATISGRSHTFTGLVAGDYYTSVEDNNGCSVTGAAITIGPGTSLSATASSTDIICRGETNGTITLTATGGSGTYEYSIDGGTTFAGSGNFTGLGVGTYTPVARDVMDAACTWTGAPITITEPPENLAISSLEETAGIPCFGDATGQISVSATGGVPAADGYTFSLTRSGTFVASQQGTSVVFSGLTAGSYEVAVTDEHTCVVSGNITLTQPTPVVFGSITEKTYTGGYHVSCAGASDGAIAVATGGGTFPHEVTIGGETQQISASGGSVTFTALPAGTHTIYVEDNNRCTISTDITLTEPDALAVTGLALKTYIGGYNVSCYGASDGEISFGTSGGNYPHTVTVNGQAYTLNNETETITVTGLSGQRYAIAIEDVNGCTYSQDVNLTSPDPLQVADMIKEELFGGYNVACRGDTDGTVKVLTTGGVFPHEVRVNSITRTNNTVSEEALFTGLPAALYDVVVMDVNGCVAGSSFEIIEPEAVTLDRVQIVEPECFRENTGSLELEAQGGVAINGLTYRYVIAHENVPPDLPFVFPSVQEQEGTTALFEDLIAGEYTVTIYDHFGCDGTADVTISTKAQITLDVDTSPVTCKGDADGAATLTIAGGASPYTMAWQDGFRQALGTVEVQEGSPVTLNNLGEGIYYLRIADANGCEFYNPNFTFGINSPAAPLDLEAVVTAISCNGTGDGSVTLEAIGGWQESQYRYGADPGDLRINNTFFSNLSPGSHSFYVQDSRGCVASLDINLSEPATLTSSVAKLTDVSCYGVPDGGIDLQIDGGTTPYNVSLDGGVTFAAATSFDNLPAGLYNIEIQDAHGCTSFETTEISEPPVLEAIVESIENTLCQQARGRASMRVTGGTAPYTYAWRDDENVLIGQDLQIAGLFDGTYQFTATDANGCSETVPLEIINTNDVIFDVANITHVTCFGADNGAAEVSITEALEPYTVSWSTGQTGNAVTGLPAGSHSVMITDANGCEVTRTFEIASPTALTGVVESTEPACFEGCDGALRIEASGGTVPYQYHWTGQGNNTSQLSGICAGAYEIKVTDGNGCTFSQTINLSQPSPLDIPIEEQIRICSGQTATVDAGLWTSYAWSSSTGFSSAVRQVTIDEAGHYEVQVTDGQGCMGTKGFELRIADDALTATFLIPEEAYVNDTVVCIDISLPIPDQVNWVYDQAAAVNLGQYDDAYQELVFVRTGRYTVTMEATLGGCHTTSTKSITILEGRGNTGGRTGGRQASLVKTFTLFPNPTDGAFEVTIDLLEEASVRLLISDLLGVQLVDHTDSGSSSYTKRFDLSNYRPGVYNILLEVKGEVKSLRFIKF